MITIDISINNVDLKESKYISNKRVNTLNEIFHNQKLSVTYYLVYRALSQHDFESSLLKVSAPCFQNNVGELRSLSSCLIPVGHTQNCANI